MSSFSTIIFHHQRLKFLVKERKIWAAANLNKNYSRKYAIPLEKETKKTGCGFSKEFVDSTNSVVVTTWYKQVLTVSNFAGKEPSDFNRKKIYVERRCR